MRLLTIGLFLLSSLGLIGCNESNPNRMAFGDLQQNASAVSLDEPEQIDIQDVDESGDSPLLDDVADDVDTEASDIEGTEAPDQAESQGLIGPDSLTEGEARKEDTEAQSLKSSGGRSRIYLSCYGGTPENERYGRNWCPAYVQDKPSIQAWANKQGLTSSEANADGYRYAFVRWVDVLRDKPSRDLRYGANQAVYPVYVITDQHGCELWHHVGSLPIGYLESKWKEAHYMQRRESPRRLSGETSQAVPLPPKDPVIVASGAGSCGPNGCKVNRKRPRF